MNRSIRSLRRRIANTEPNAMGRRRYPADLRQEVVGLAESWRSQGKPIRALAAELGMSKDTLGGWMATRQEEAQVGARVRNVVIAEPECPAVIVMPSGVRIESSDLEATVFLARELG